MDMLEFLKYVAMGVFENENAVLNIMLSPDFTEIQLIPKDLWEETEG